MQIWISPHTFFLVPKQDNFSFPLEVGSIKILSSNSADWPYLCCIQKGSIDSGRKINAGFHLYQKYKLTSKETDLVSLDLV